MQAAQDISIQFHIPTKQQTGHTRMYVRLTAAQIFISSSDMSQA